MDNLKMFIQNELKFMQEKYDIIDYTVINKYNNNVLLVYYHYKNKYFLRGIISNTNKKPVVYNVVYNNDTINLYDNIYNLASRIFCINLQNIFYNEENYYIMNKDISIGTYYNEINNFLCKLIKKYPDNFNKMKFIKIDSLYPVPMIRENRLSDYGGILTINKNKLNILIYDNDFLYHKINIKKIFKSCNNKLFVDTLLYPKSEYELFCLPDISYILEDILKQIKIPVTETKYHYIPGYLLYKNNDYLYIKDITEQEQYKIRLDSININEQFNIILTKDISNPAYNLQLKIFDSSFKNDISKFILK